MIHRRYPTGFLLILVGAGLFPSIPARAQDAQPSAADLRAQIGARAVAVDPPVAEAPLDLWPEFSPLTLAWISAVVILVLTIQSRPLLGWQTLDGVVLAAMSVLLALRDGSAAASERVRWWAYLLLSLSAVYWMIRGLRLVVARAVPARQANVATPALVVLLATTVLLAMRQIATAPLSAGARDGFIGGIFTAETGKLPYGDALGHDARSPLLYLAHAGAVRLVRSTYDHDGVTTPVSWSNRDAWLAPAAFATADLGSVRLMNWTLFALAAFGLGLIGARLHSPPLGLTLATLFSVFPGTLECLPRPEIMLPATLLLWTAVAATLPAVGGLLSSILLVMAGAAWPWAWLGVPVLLAYFLRRGLPGLGAPVGTLAAAAGCVAGLTLMTAPTIPRAEGALQVAALQPAYQARSSAETAIVIERITTPATVEPTLKSGPWRFLIESESVRLNDGPNGPMLPAGVDRSAVMYRQVAASAEALPRLQAAYRKALADEPFMTRMWVTLRTVLEATWLPAQPPPSPVSGAWALWAGQDTSAASRWTFIRRSMKVAVGLAAVLVALMVLQRPGAAAPQLVGGLLVVAAGTLLASELGAATNLVWLLPVALAALAANSGAATPRVLVPAVSAAAPPVRPAPRITVER